MNIELLATAIKQYKFLLLCVIFIVAPHVYAKNLISYDLPMQWKFSTDHKKQGIALGWHNIGSDVDKDWKTINVGKYWESEGYNFNGVAWYRCKFKIESAFQNRDLVLILPKIDESDITYLNGKKIGSITNNHSATRIYTIPNNLLRFNTTNYIAVRVTDNYKGGGMYKGHPEIREVGFDTLTMSGNLSSQLNGYWQVSFDNDVYEINQNSKLELQNDNPWKWITAGRAWEEFGFEHDGKAWLRKRFTLPKKLQNKPLYLSFSKINDKGSVYLNGVKIASVQNNLEGRIVKIPAGLLYQNKKNELVVLVVDKGGKGGVLAMMELQTPGIVTAKLDPQNFSKGYCDLNVLAKFAWEDERKGLGLGWHTKSFDDSHWHYMKVGKSWKEMGISNPEGSGWYRFNVLIPEEWRGVPLELALKNPLNHVDIFVNEKSRGTLSWPRMKRPYQAVGEYFIIDPKWIEFGKENMIALRVTNENRQGGLTSRNYIKPHVPYVKSHSGDESWDFPFNTKMGDKPGKEYTFSFTFPKPSLRPPPQSILFDSVDYYNRKLTSGTFPVTETEDGYSVTVSLNKKQSEQLYYAERFEYTIIDKKNKKTWNGEVRGFNYTDRDNKILPVQDLIFEETPLGKLKLIDKIDFSNTTTNEHPYKEGSLSRWKSKRHRPRKIRDDSPRTENINGRRALLPNDRSYFAYRIGRGELKPFTPYLLVIDYPEDMTRYFSIDVQVGKTYFPFGWKTGVSKNDPMWNTPISKKWEQMDALVVLGEKAYGHSGFQSTSTKNGFWVWFQNKGEKYYPQYDGNLAVGSMSLYELNPKDYTPTIRAPTKTRERILMSDAEFPMHEQAELYVQHAKSMGLNTISPIVMQWGHKKYWYSKDERVTQQKRDKISKYQEFLISCKKNNLGLIPRIEYGGSRQLPDEAKIIAPDGKIDPVGRYVNFGPNILHPLVLKDFQSVIDELITERIHEYPMIKGALWRIRSNSIAPSYGDNDIILYFTEMGKELPHRNFNKLRILLSSGSERKSYLNWWQKKRAEFLAKITAHIKSIRKDLILLYNPLDDDKYQLGPGWYNWGNLGKIKDNNTAKKLYTDFTRFYNLRSGGDFIDIALTESKYNPPGELMIMKLLGKIDGLYPFGVATHRYLTDNPEYLNYFKTNNGTAIANMPPYDEIARKGLHQTYECDFSMPGRSAFSLKPEIESLFHADPVIFSHTVYAYGRTFSGAHRKFAQAFLALPFSKGIDVPHNNKTLKNDLKFRWYPDEKRLALIYKGFQDTRAKVTLPEAFKAMKMTSLSGDKNIAINEDGSLILNLKPMELRCYGVAQ